MTTTSAATAAIAVTVITLTLSLSLLATSLRKLLIFARVHAEVGVFVRSCGGLVDRCELEHREGERVTTTRLAVFFCTQRAEKHREQDKMRVSSVVARAAILSLDVGSFID